jgi:hypothetical protein
MAEYAVAGILHFAKGFPRAAIDRDAASTARTLLAFDSDSSCAAAAVR